MKLNKKQEMKEELKRLMFEQASHEIKLSKELQVAWRLNDRIYQLIEKL